MRSRFSFDWTDEKCEELRQLTAEKVPPRQIGIRMGLSKNAIIGKQARLGISTGQRRGYHTDYPTNRKSAVILKFRKPPTFPLPQFSDTIEPLRIGFMDLQSRHCRWVLQERGHDGLATFCGHDRFLTQSYCLEHLHITHNFD